MENSNSLYFKYWGKAKGDDYHLLVYHCLDVAAVGYYLLDTDKPLAKDLSNFLDVSPEHLRQLFVFCLVLHDLGKFSSAFQSLQSFDNLVRANARFPYNGKDFRHDMLGNFFWQTFIQDDLIQLPGLRELGRREKHYALKSFMVMLECTLGHHGKPIRVAGIIDMKPYTEKQNIEAASAFTQDIIDFLLPEIPIEKLVDSNWCKRLEQVSWSLAGVAVLADWVGSDKEYFQYQSTPMPLPEYWSHAKAIALKALSATDINHKVRVKPFESIQAHFGFTPTPLQQWAESVPVDNSPQLFILEDVTGAGKTEAALALTHRLMAADAADGFYFGLPTMATSNAMFKRVGASYLQMLRLDTGVPSIVLAHGSRDMNEQFREAVLAGGVQDSDYNNDDSTATAQCNVWLADSRKKALLAPVGVGTIDQALLAVLPRRHQSLRLLGLHRKVLIFDEVHAADEFMFELLESLLALHLHQGGSAVLLTATLSQKQRTKLCHIWHKAGDVPVRSPSSSNFPLATKVSLSTATPLVEQPLASRADVSREVNVSFLHSVDTCVERVLAAVNAGQCVVWVRNSVDDVLQAYTDISQKLDNPDDCLVFHSRFILRDRMTIEKKVLDIFGKGSEGAMRKGKVLICSQVFQESLDADADIMISDICPIDDLIQRAGRLHRHTRNSLGTFEHGITDCRAKPELWVHTPEWDDAPASDWLSQSFRNTQFVYKSPGRLWLGMQQLRKLGCIRMPEDARVFIESVYSDEAQSNIPESLEYRELKLVGDERSKAAKAKNQLLKWELYGYCESSAHAWYEDDSDISTRHSDIETVEIVLVRETAQGELEPWVHTEKHAVQLSTVKLSKNKYADKLQPISEKLEAAKNNLEKRYTRVKYMQCWMPDNDSNFVYNPTMGFVDRRIQEVQ